MREYIESIKNGDQLEEKVKELSQALGIERVGGFGAKYIEHRIINKETLGYSVFPAIGESDYVVIDEVNSGAGGRCGGLSPGPLHRLRCNGFIVVKTSTYVDGACPRVLQEYRGQLPDDFIATYIRYVGKEHPIIEYMDEDE